MSKNYKMRWMMYAEEKGALHGSRGLTVLRVEPGSRVRVCLQSEAVEVVSTHWFSRQFLCGGLDCPACGTYAARTMIFAVGMVEVGMQWKPCLVELSAAAWSGLRLLSEMEQAVPGSGMVVELSRKSKRRGIRAEPVCVTGPVSDALISRERLVDAIGLLFSLPARAETMTAAEWVEYVRPAVLAACARGMRAAG